MQDLFCPVNGNIKVVSKVLLFLKKILLTRHVSLRYHKKKGEGGRFLCYQHVAPPGLEFKKCRSLSPYFLNAAGTTYW